MSIKKLSANRTEIVKILSDILDPWLEDTDDAKSLNEQTNLLSDLGLDSVVILQLILGIEKEFDITIGDSEIDSDMFLKLANLVNIIQEKLNEAD